MGYKERGGVILLPAILYGLGYMTGFNGRTTIKVGYSAGDFDYPVIGPGGERQLAHSAFQQQT